MRKSFSINSGAKPAAYASDDFIMFKVLRRPTIDDFRSKLDEAQAWASSVGYTEEDADDIIKSFRERKRS